MTLDGALRRLARELEEANVAFAVVGGLAASARGEVRFTRGVDIAVVVESDAEAEALIHRPIQPAGSAPASLVTIT